MQNLGLDLGGEGHRNVSVLNSTQVIALNYLIKLNRGARVMFGNVWYDLDKKQFQGFCRGVKLLMSDTEYEQLKKAYRHHLTKESARDVTFMETDTSTKLINAPHLRMP